jgi:5-formyltetrahydrofolate cyclo-ligase
VSASAKARKAALRSSLRRRRQRLDPAARAAAAERLAGHGSRLPGWEKGARIAAYRAADGELDPAPLLAEAIVAGLRTYLPCIGTDRSLVFRHWRPGEPLLENRYGIGEPQRDAETVTAGALQLLCVPLVGFTATGTRLGMGAGFYDRAIAQGRPGCVAGIAYGWQECDDIPRESWDAPLDGVLTEDGWRPLG